MPETEYEFISDEYLQNELLTIPAEATATATATETTINNVHHAKDIIILDCRSFNEFTDSHIRSAVNFSIPSIMLRRLAAGKIDLLSTIKSHELKQRIQNGYKVSLFVLYADTTTTAAAATATAAIPLSTGKPAMTANTIITTTTTSITPAAPQPPQPPLSPTSSVTSSKLPSTAAAAASAANCNMTCATINVLYKRLKQDGCRVVTLKGGFSSFHQAFPEWCVGNNPTTNLNGLQCTRNTQADQLMGLRSLRISSPQYSDSACSSSAESSDCESITLQHKHSLNSAPVEIIPGLYLGNAMHSCDARTLQKYNIKYILNVTKDLPNVFEATGEVRYLQIPITDHYSQDLAVHFPVAIQFIEEARMKNASVLVHCLAGVSRSVTITLAYLMHARALCLNDAFTLVRKRKPDVSPNFHFMQQLYLFESQLGLNTKTDNKETLAIESIRAMDKNSNSNSNNSSGVSSVVDAMSLCHRTTSTNLDVVMPSSKFSCNCLTTRCNCVLSPTYLNQLAKGATGLSPDSGIEFDRWVQSSDTGA